MTIINNNDVKITTEALTGKLNKREKETPPQPPAMPNKADRIKNVFKSKVNW